MFKIPSDLCSEAGLGSVIKNVGAREQSLIANVCKIKDVSDEILNKFREITESTQKYPNAPVDTQEELNFYNTKLSKIQNIANASKVT
jgi:hypothetical protein